LQKQKNYNFPIGIQEGKKQSQLANTQEKQDSASQALSPPRQTNTRENRKQHSRASGRGQGRGQGRGPGRAWFGMKRLVEHLEAALPKALVKDIAQMARTASGL